MKYPTPPPELVFAMAVDVSNLRPWEFWMCDSEEYYLITTLRAEYENARKEARALIEAQPEM